MKRKRYIPCAAPLPMAAQAIGLKALFPHGTLSLSRYALTWEGILSPHAGSRNYAVRMDFSPGKHPRVYVKTPNLKALSGGRRLPHVYDQEKQRLCLYLPAAGFWSPNKSIAGTVMKWALAWLAFFEIWLMTDVWHGRGVGHPGDDPTLYDF